MRNKKKGKSWTRHIPFWNAPDMKFWKWIFVIFGGLLFLIAIGVLK